jgi:uncharacterized membrane protein (GlpM family)
VSIEWIELLYTPLKFVIAGGMVVGVTWLARYVDPKYGGILVAAPIVTTLAFFFTYAENDIQTTQQLVLASFTFMIPTVLFVLVLYLLMYRLTFFSSLAVAYSIWIAGVLILNRVLGNS